MSFDTMPKDYGTNLVSNGFIYKNKQVNRNVQKMSKTEIIAKIIICYGRIKNSINNFQNRYSNVIAYFMLLPIPLIMLLIENIIH